ncbi:TPA: histidine phosphatase family protein [Campylobacter coli]|nr:histidine phosphatase family protein [Campylobacter coli]
MKKIYILRHAKAVKDEEVQDFDRKLSKRGKEDLEKLFYNLKTHEIKFDFILSSSSKRTAKTAKKIAEFYNFDKEKIQFIDELYLANLSKIYQILQTVDKKYNEVLLVGHNPTLMELGEFLGSLCLTSFPTSSMLCLEFDIEDFKDLCRRKNKISIWKNKTSIKVEILFFYKP